jgi:aspartokinase
MIKVTDIVSDILKTDELVSESMRAGLLNLSAYAAKIHSQVENLTKKPVKKGTIVVALSRIAGNKENLKPALKPDIKLSNIAIRSSLSAVIFDKTADIQRKLAVLHPFQISINEIFGISEGPNEITLIYDEKAQEKIQKSFSTEAKFEFNDLVAITVQYAEEYAIMPNIYYVLLSALAAKRINIFDMIATYTEISFIVRRENMEEALNALNTYFVKPA